MMAEHKWGDVGGAPYTGKFHRLFPVNSSFPKLKWGVLFSVFFCNRKGYQVGTNWKIEKVQNRRKLEASARVIVIVASKKMMASSNKDLGLGFLTHCEPGEGTNDATIDAAATGDPDKSYTTPGFLSLKLNLQVKTCGKPAGPVRPGMSNAMIVEGLWMLRLRATQP